MKPYSLKLKIFIFSYLVFTFLFINLGYTQKAEIAKYPERPITFIVSSPAGSIVDVSCRLLCKEAEKFLGKPIIVLNKAGGSMTIGPAAIAAAKPDGYTIGLVQHTSLTVALTETVPYHPIKSFKQIIQWGGQYMGVSSKGDGPLKSFNDLIAYARQNPKKLTIATTGGKTTTYYFMEYIAKKERLEFTYIPTEVARPTRRQF